MLNEKFEDFPFFKIEFKLRNWVYDFKSYAFEERNTTLRKCLKSDYNSNLHKKFDELDLKNAFCIP